MSALHSSSRIAAPAKPTSGESSNDCPTFVAYPQSTPLVPVFGPDINWFAMPTPMMDPINVCELEAGNPKYQVPRFQMIAANQQREYHRESRAWLPT